MPQNQVKAFGGVKKIAMTMVASVKDEAKKLEEFSSLGLFVTVLLSDTGFTVRKETYEEAGSKFKYVFRGLDSYLIKNTGMDTGEAVIYSIKKTGKFVVTGYKKADKWVEIKTGKDIPEAVKYSISKSSEFITYIYRSTNDWVKDKTGKNISEAVVYGLSESEKAAGNFDRWVKKKTGKDIKGAVKFGLEETGKVISETKKEVEKRWENLFKKEDK